QQPRDPEQPGSGDRAHRCGKDARTDRGGGQGGRAPRRAEAARLLPSRHVYVGEGHRIAARRAAVADRGAAERGAAIRAEPAVAARLAPEPRAAVQALQLTAGRAAHARRSGAGAGPYPQRGPRPGSGDAGAPPAGGGSAGAIPVGHRALRAVEVRTSLAEAAVARKARKSSRPMPNALPDRSAVATGRRLQVSSATSACSVPFTLSSRMRSPSRTLPSGPPLAASGVR